MSPYNYVYDNPNNYIDPTGKVVIGLYFETGFQYFSPKGTISIGLLFDNKKIGLFIGGSAGIGLGAGVFAGANLQIYPKAKTIDEVKGLGIEIGAYGGVGTAFTSLELDAALKNDDFRLGLVGGLPLLGGGFGGGIYFGLNYLDLIGEITWEDLLKNIKEFIKSPLAQLLKNKLNLTDEQLVDYLLNINRLTNNLNNSDSEKKEDNDDYYKNKREKDKREKKWYEVGKFGSFNAKYAQPSN